MALHRDIFWVGRQWTVTGYGIQACDQKHKGNYDVEACRLWEPGLLDRMRQLSWLNAVDFEKAVVVARKYYPEPAATEPAATKVAPKPSSPEAGVLSLIQEVLKDTSLKEAMLKDSGRRELSMVGSVVTPADNPPPAQPVERFDMRVQGWPAKFLRPWRIRVRR